MTSVKQWGTAVVVSALAVVTAFAAPSASAATPTVPAQAITNDPNASNGSVAFYNSTGARVTSGNNLHHLFDYALASTPASRQKSTKATLYFGFPDHNQSDSQNWVQQQQSASTNYPNANAPAPLASSPNPLVTLPTADADYSAAAVGVTLDTTAGYAGIVQVRVWDSGPGVPFTPPFWASDIYIDTTAGTWQQVYPAVSGPVATTTSLVASPSSTTTGKTVTLTATVLPSGAAGTVRFSDGTKDIGSPVAVSGGTASVTTGALAVGSHTFTATYVPTDTAAYSGSTASTTVAVAAPKPDATSLTISKNSTVTYGKTVALHGTLTDTTTHKPIANAVVYVYYRHKTTGAFTKGPSVRSSAKGAVSKSLKPLAKTYYEWRYLGSATHAAKTSAVDSVSVKQTATIHATPTKVTHGKSLKVWGSVAPSVSGRKITLQKKSGSVYKTVTSTKTKRQKLPNGSTAIGYVFTVKLVSKGTFSYRVTVAATSTLVSGTSAAIAVKAV